MIIAVTDACVFIDLLDLDLTDEFFDLNLDIHTTVEVWNEIDSDQLAILSKFRSSNKLKVHILEESQVNEMDKMFFPKALSDPDKSVIYVARKLGAMLLSSDSPVRKFAEKSAIETHGLLWILDELVKRSIISRYLAAQKLEHLTSTNIMYLNNTKLQKEINARLRKWREVE